MIFFLAIISITWLGLQLEGTLRILKTIQELKMQYRLAAIMLGRLRMTVDEALDQYAEFGNEVFGKPRWFHERSLLWYPRAKFSCRKTRDAFKSVVYRSIISQRDNIQDWEASAAASAEPFKCREDRTRT